MPLTPLVKKRPLLVFLLLAAGVVAISSAAVLIKLTPAPPLTVAFYRMGFSALIMWPIYKIRNERLTERIHQRAAIVAGVFLAGHFALWISSLKFTSVANSLILVTMNPIFVGIGSVLILRERSTPALMMGTGLSMVGCVTLLLGSASSGQGGWTGNLLALSGAVGMSGYMLVGRGIRKRVALIPYITWVYGVAAVVLGLLCLLTRSPLLPESPEILGLLLLIALIPQLIGHSIINWVLRYVPPSYVAVVILLEPITGSLLAYLILAEQPTVWTALGGSLVIIGILIALAASDPDEISST